MTTLHKHNVSAPGPASEAVLAAGGSGGRKIPTIGIPPQHSWGDAGLHGLRYPVVPCRQVPVPGVHGERGGWESVYLHVALLNELEEAEGVGELQADGAAVERGGSLPQHLLIPVLAELGHQLREQTVRVMGRVRGSCLMWLQCPAWPCPPGAEEGGVRGTL